MLFNLDTEDDTEKRMYAPWILTPLGSTGIQRNMCRQASKYSKACVLDVMIDEKKGTESQIL